KKLSQNVTVVAESDTKMFLPVVHPGLDLSRQAAEVLADRLGVARHDIGVVLSSGWFHTIDALGKINCVMLFDDFPLHVGDGVAGHVQKVTSVRLPNGHNVLVFGSRTHYYANRDAQAVAHVVRTIAAAGAATVVLTNGCGGLDPQV